MTIPSTQKQMIPISSLRIGERFSLERKDLGDVDSLAASFARVGQLQPIVVDKDHNLIFGLRRTEAAKLLQWDEIWAVYKDDIDETLAKEIELEENLRRKDFHWTEEVLGVEKLFNLRQARYGKGIKGRSGIASQIEEGGFTIEDMGEELERSKTNVHLDLTLAQGLREYPEISKEPTKSSAFKVYRLKKETALREEQARRTRGPLADSASERKSFDEWQKENGKDGKEVNRQPILKTIFKEKESVLYHADSRDVLRFFAERNVKVDCIVTDPPFGLGMHKEGQSLSGGRLGENIGDMYDDDPHLIMDMLDQVFMYAGKCLKENGHAYVFFHHTRYEQIYLMLRKHFGDCEETPLVWIKNTPGVGDPNKSWVYAYEPCFFINKGRSLMVPQAFNYLKYDTIPPGQKIHPTEKPAALLRHLISASCVNGEVVLDPFAGSGSTLVAADQVGCRFIGIEKHEGFYRKAVERLAEKLHEHDEQRGNASIQDNVG